MGLDTEAASAAQVTLEWDRNSEPQVTGYRIYYGFESRYDKPSGWLYEQKHDAGNTNRCTIDNLVCDRAYFFSATAYDGAGNESDYSVEVSALMPCNEVVPQADPLEVTDISLSGFEDTPLVGTLEAACPTGSSLTYSLASAPAYGTVVVTDPGSGVFVYTPLNDFNGQDAFTFTVADSSGGTATAKATLVIAPQNDPPASAGASISVPEDGLCSGVLLGSDPDGGALYFSISQGPALGTVEITDPSTGLFTYRPFTDRDGTDRFVFQVSDGMAASFSEVTVTIASINDPPVGQGGQVTLHQDGSFSGRLNGWDVEGSPLLYRIISAPGMGRLELVDYRTGDFTYTPALGFQGTDVFSFVVNDGQADSGAATMEVKVQPHVSLLVEAEQGAYGSMVGLCSLATASGGQCLRVSERPTFTTPWSTHTFQVPMAGDYYLWTRMDVSSEYKNDMSISWDGADPMPWRASLSGKSQWAWNGVSERAGGSPGAFYLEEGLHTLTVSYKERGQMVDRFLLTTNANPFQEQVLEDAESGHCDRWVPGGAYGEGYSPVLLYDETRESNALYFPSTVSSQGWSLQTNTADALIGKNMLRWSAVPKNDFGIMVDVDTAYGRRALVYKALSQESSSVGPYYIIGLGGGLTDGEWHSFTRSLNVDIARLDLGNTLVAVRGISVYGQGWLDDLRLGAAP